MILQHCWAIHIKFKIYLSLFVQVQNMSNTFHLGYGLFPFCLGSSLYVAKNSVSRPVISSTQSFDLYLLQKGLKSLSGGYWKLRIVNCQPWQKCWLWERERQLQSDVINQDVTGQVWYGKYFRSIIAIESCWSEIIRLVETIAARNLWDDFLK